MHAIQQAQFPPNIFSHFSVSLYILLSINKKCDSDAIFVYNPKGKCYDYFTRS